jgi:hypothetical protein
MNIINIIKLRIFTDSYYAGVIKKTKKESLMEYKKALPDEKERIIYDRDSELRIIYDDWEDSKSDKIIKKAKKYDLDIPYKHITGNEQYWDESYIGVSYLNSKGRNYIRNNLREEVKWKRERISLFVSIVFGLLGGVTGLIAVIFK